MLPVPLAWNALPTDNLPYFRGLPIHSPTFTVVLLGTDKLLGVFDDEMEVAAFLAFEKLGRDGVEVLVDRSRMAILTGCGRRRGGV